MSTKILIGILILIAAALVLFNLDSQNSKQDTTELRTIEGEVVCLPKKGDGPHTLECAYGLESAGVYYGLTNLHLSNHQLNTSDNIRVQGHLSDPDPDTTYDIVGNIDVINIQPLD